MPRRHRRDLPRWRRGHAVTVRPVQLSGRQARQFAREYARVTRTGPAAANGTLAATGAWRFRRHLVPFAWLAVTLARLPVLAAAGFGPPVPAALAVTWAPFALAWVRHYAWRPAAAASPQQDVPGARSDEVTWERLAKRRKWSGALGPLEQ